MVFSPLNYHINDALASLAKFGRTIWSMVQAKRVEIRSKILGSGYIDTVDGVVLVKEEDPLCTVLLNLAKHKKFDKIEEILQNTDRCYLTRWLDVTRVSSHSTLLHLILEYQPTTTCVHIVIQRLRDQNPCGGGGILTATDAHGRNPLHVAVMNGCDVSVIEYLIHCPNDDATSDDETLKPATMKDKMGRLPLHWACAYNAQKQSRKRGLRKALFTNLHCARRSISKNKENMRRVIEVLVKAYPSTVSVPDQSRRTALEYATENKLDHHIVRMLGQSTKFFHDPMNHNFLLKDSVPTLVEQYPGAYIDKTQNPKSDTLLFQHRTIQQCDVPREIVLMETKEDDSTMGSMGVVSRFYSKGRIVLTKRNCRKRYPIPTTIHQYELVQF